MHVALSHEAFKLLSRVVSEASFRAPLDAPGVVAMNQLRRASLVELADAILTATSLGEQAARLGRGQQDLAVIKLEIPEPV